MKVKISIWIVTLSLLTFSNSIACTCGTSLSENLRGSNFIGHVKFLEIHRSEINDLNYEAKFEIIEKFKGPEISSIWIDEGELCDQLNLKPGDELVIFSRKDYLNKNSTGFCSSNFNPNDEYYSLNLEVLKSIKNQNINLTQEFIFDFENSFFNRVGGLEINLPDKDFGIYEVSYDRLNFFIDVMVLESFGSKTDKDIISLIQEADWIFYHSYGNFDPQLFKFLLIIEKEEWKGKYVTKYNYL
ncbi:MAG TPA: hypothetical protein VLA71_02810 [Algoriphagus sp.]|nr:hypothetical protein [Algoriphagus sp.]